MKVRNIFLFTILVVLIFNLTGFAQVSTGKEAANFTLPDLQGKNFTLKDNLGKKLTLVNFWATWCTPCRAEMKKLKKIQKEFEKKGLKIICISVDDPKTASKVKSFIKTNRYKFKVLLDTNNDVMRLYQVTNPPYTLLLDENGDILYTHLGYRKGDEKLLTEKIKKLLNKN